MVSRSRSGRGSGRIRSMERGRNGLIRCQRKSRVRGARLRLTLPGNAYAEAGRDVDCYRRTSSIAGSRGPVLRDSSIFTAAWSRDGSEVPQRTKERSLGETGLSARPDRPLAARAGNPGGSTAGSTAKCPFRRRARGLFFAPGSPFAERVGVRGVAPPDQRERLQIQRSGRALRTRGLEDSSPACCHVGRSIFRSFAFVSIVAVLP
jgi:hypothetical protein